jgi:hypothetical protein
VRPNDGPQVEAEVSEVSEVQKVVDVNTTLQKWFADRRQDGETFAHLLKRDAEAKRVFEAWHEYDQNRMSANFLKAHGPKVGADHGNTFDHDVKAYKTANPRATRGDVLASVYTARKMAGKPC